MSYRGCSQAQGRVNRRRGGNDRLPGAQCCAHVGHVHGTCTAETEDHIVAYIHTAAHRHAHDQVRHVRIDDLVSALGHFHHVHSQDGSHTVECLPGTFRLQRHTSAVEVFRIDIAQDHRGIGHCRLFPAEPVTGRTRIGACALRTHVQRLQFRVGVDDGAPARADGYDVQRRIQGAEFFDTRFTVEGFLSIGNQAYIKSRAADIGRDDIVITQDTAERAGRFYSTCRPGVDRGDRQHGVRIRYSAIGFHQQQSRFQPLFPEKSGYGFHIVQCCRAYISIQHRGDETFVFPFQRHHFTGSAAIQVRVQFLDDFLCPQFVSAVCKRPQEANGDTFDTLLNEIRYGLAHVVFIQRHHLAAGIIHAFTYLPG